MILLMTGLLSQIQGNRRIWSKVDQPKEEEKKDVLKTPPKKKSFWGLGGGSKKTPPKPTDDQAGLKIDHIGDLFALNKFDQEPKEMRGYHLNQTPLSILSNLISFFEIQPLYFRNFTLMNIIRVVDNFYLEHQSILKPSNTDGNPNFIPPSILDTTDPTFQNTLLGLYKTSLAEMNFLLNDSRIYIEHHYRPNAGFKSEINYHCWFLYETFVEYLKESTETVLNNRYLDRYISHPVNILQYYQPNQLGQATIEIPSVLKTHF